MSARQHIGLSKRCAAGMHVGLSIHLPLSIHSQSGFISDSTLENSIEEATDTWWPGDKVT